MPAPKIIAGAPGFTYKPWEGPFCPENLPESEMLTYYADRLVFTFAVKASRRMAFEFRHPTWFDGDVADALSQAGAALCVAQTNADEKQARIHHHRGVGLSKVAPRGLY